MNHHLLRQEGREAITVFHEGEVYVADDNHPNWNAIKGAVLDFDEDDDPFRVIELFDTEKTLNREFKRLSERVLVRDGVIYVDGEEVENSLTRQVLRFLEQGLEFAPLVNFFEKVLTNPNEHSRDHLYRWLKDRDFTITPDGDFIAYKGVQRDPDADDEQSAGLVSITEGKNVVIVDGKEVTGRVPNNPGSIVEMPRSEVTFDPARGCDVGLHAGTWGYASGFGRGYDGHTILEVRINPRDVVSVPTDSSDQKLRVCRYTVLKAVTEERTSALADDLDDDTSDSDEVCADCQANIPEEEVHYERGEAFCDEVCAENYFEEDEDTSDDFNDDNDPIAKYRF